MENGEIGGIGIRIRELREQAGLQGKELAEELQLDASVISKIETGQRSVKTSELLAIAKTFGVSPLAILEPDSLLARLPVAARTLNDELDRTLHLRLTALAELHEVLRRADIGARIRTCLPTEVISTNWLETAKWLASWAREKLEVEPSNNRFGSLASAIEEHLGIDVLVESYDDAVMGAAITDPEFPLILVNADQPQNRALFTLAHELGHTLAGDGSAYFVHRSLSGTDTQERRANAFAAELLMPEDEFNGLLDAAAYTPEALGEIMLRLSVSWESLVYRLHNLRLTDAQGRDRLLEIGFSGLCTSISDPELTARLRQQRSVCVFRPPTLLRERLETGYQNGVVSVRPLAGILNCEPESLLEPFGAEALSEAIKPNHQPAADEELYAGEPI